MKHSYRELSARCDAYAANVRKRARKLTAEAGLDPNLLGIHPHNAMCSYRAGHPWPNVDYRKVRKVLWLSERQWAAQRALDALYSRLGYDGFTWGR
jgi:hypothetical protein